MNGFKKIADAIKRFDIKTTGGDQDDGQNQIGPQFQRILKLEIG
jgi:hypothetical protein